MRHEISPIHKHHSKIQKKISRVKKRHTQRERGRSKQVKSTGVRKKSVTEHERLFSWSL